MRSKFYIAAMAFAIFACEPEIKLYDASGSFEAIETIVSSEAAGVLLEFDIEEGQHITEGHLIGQVDTIQLHLSKKQLKAQIKAIGNRSPNIAAQTAFYDDQLAVINTQVSNLESEQKRFENLVAGQAIPQKQLDDLNAKISEIEKQKAVIQKQKTAQVSALSTQTKSLKSEPFPIYAQIEQIEDQIRRSTILSPKSGTVLTKYAEEKEMTGLGQPLFKMADLSSMILKAYITGNQLPKVKLNQKVVVMTDDGDGGFDQREGQITWISDKSEFTPKTIQTKEERANLVYAIKVKVVNDGRYKIGMYGEIRLQ